VAFLVAVAAVLVLVPAAQCLGDKKATAVAYAHLDSEHGASQEASGGVSSNGREQWGSVSLRGTYRGGTTRGSISGHTTASRANSDLSLSIMTQNNLTPCKGKGGCFAAVNARASGMFPGTRDVRLSLVKPTNPSATGSTTVRANEREEMDGYP